MHLARRATALYSSSPLRFHIIAPPRPTWHKHALFTSRPSPVVRSPPLNSTGGGGSSGGGGRSGGGGGGGSSGGGESLGGLCGIWALYLSLLNKKPVGCVAHGGLSL